MAMWLKFAFLLLYLVLLALVAHLLDWTLRWELSAGTLLPSHLLMDTLSLSVTQLKRVLETRGVQHVALLEKSELRHLVHLSGRVTQEELDHIDRVPISTSTNLPQDDLASCEVKALAPHQCSAASSSNSQESSDNNSNRAFTFISGAHLDEIVEDTKDSAWLIQVVPSSGSSPARNSNGLPTQPSEARNVIGGLLWETLIAKCSQYGIRVGLFDCDFDPLVCEAKNWNSVRLILALPRAESKRSKGDVVLTELGINSQNARMRPISEWIARQLEKRVHQINSSHVDTSDEAVSTSSAATATEAQEFSVLFVSSLATSPLLISALAIKFNGRIKFSSMATATKTPARVLIRVPETRWMHPIRWTAASRRRATRPVAAPLYEYEYGSRPGEILQYSHLELFLRTLRPEMNDLFILSLTLANVVTLLEVFWKRFSRLWKYFVSLLIQLVRINYLILMFWLIAVGLCQFSHFQMFVILPASSLSRWCALSAGGSLARYYYLAILKHLPLPCHALIIGLAGGLLAWTRRRLFPGPRPDDDGGLPEFRDWTSWDSGIISYFLFSPMGFAVNSANFGVPSAANLTAGDMETTLQDQMHQLIERMAFPALWLQTSDHILSHDYIAQLPVWTHRPNSSAPQSPITSDTDTDVECITSGMASATTATATVSQRSSHLHHHSNHRNRYTNTAAHHQQPKHHRDHQETCQSSHGTNLSVTARPSVLRRISQACRFRTPRPRSATNNEAKTARGYESPSTSTLCSSDRPHWILPVGEDCAICLDRYHTGESLCGLPCGHAFHQSCVVTWLSRDNHCCPICRWPPYKSHRSGATTATHTVEAIGH